jgi:RHS repeat-associated protein
MGSLYNNGKSCCVLIDKGYTSSQNGYKTLIVYKDNNGNPKSTGSYLPLQESPQKVFIADYDGDGMQDLLVLQESGYKIFWNKGVAEGSVPFSDDKTTTGDNLKDTWIMQPGDFNGDGLPDFVSNQTDYNYWYFYFNNGNGTFAKKEAIILDGVHDCTFTERDDSRFSCHVFDFNCDGRDDVVITRAQYQHKNGWGKFQKTYTYWLTTNGTSLSLVKTASSNKDSDALNGYFMTGDFNGDGLTELINYGYNCYGSTNANVNPAWHIYNNSSVTANTNKLTSISVGQSGIYTGITYSTLCDASIYTKDNSSAYPVATMSVPLNVVKQVTQILAYNYYYTNYKYKGLRAHLCGRGLLGFTTVEASNSTTGETRTTTINSLHPSFYEPSKITSTVTKGGKTETTETTMAVIINNGKCHFTYPQNIKQTDFYGDVVTTTNSYNVGNYYLTKQRTEYGNSNMYKMAEYSSFIKVGGVYKPQTVVATQKHSDDADAFSQKTTYEYNNKGAVTEMIENASTAAPVTHKYTYDKLGNMLTHMVSGSGIDTDTTTLTYDTTNRYVATEKSSANSIVTKYEYNTFGWLTAKKEGVSGSQLTTSYTYDAVGNITKITHPDNTTTTYTRSWGNSGYKTYSVTATTTGQAPVTTWYDNTGREVISSTKGEKGVGLTCSTSYNSKNGKVDTQTKSIGTISLTNSYTYNDMGQLTKSVTGEGQTTAYSYSKRSVTATQSGNNNVLQKNFDMWGNLIHVSHNSCTAIRYTYCSASQPKTVRYSDATSQEYNVLTMTYDNRGLQTSLTDVDAGKTIYEYDALGRITKQTDARNNITTNTYNASGLLTKQVCGNVTTTYEYDSRLRLTKETTGNQSIAYEYDNLNHLTKKIYTIDGTSLTYSYVYNNGQMVSQTFPDGMKEDYTYDSYGNLATIKIGGQRVWELNSYNGTQRTAYLGTAPLILTKNYSTKGLLTGTSVKKGSTTLHSFGYTFDGATGNLTQRTGMNGTESFKYDQFDRLTTGTSYALSGNISSKTGIGSYTYDANKKHAVVQVANTNNLIQGTASVTYNAFNKVATVVQGTNTLTITYGPDHQRTKTVLVNGSNTTTTLYADNYEQRTANGVTTTYHYVASPDGLAAVYVKSGNTATAYYIETDHLGSIIRAYDYIGNTKFSAAYDAWGNQTVSTNAIGLTRGYTGHEHWNQFGLIDMNGRFYDPLLGRFLSPDPYVQAPENPQNYNRYAYCLNNPLKYTDPSGEYFGIDDLIAGAIGGTVNLVVNAIQGNLGGHGVWGGIGRGFAAFGAGAVGGVGALYPEFGGWAWGGAAVGATNAWLGGASSASDIAMGACVGAVAGMVGGAAGQWATTATSPLVSSISSPVARSTVSGIIGGAAGGYAGGFVGGYLMTGDISAANKAGLSGMWTGAGIGGVTGGFAGFRYAKANGLNPWNGRVNVDSWVPLKPIGCDGIEYYNSSYSDSKSLMIPSKLSHYTQNDPTTWTTLGTIPDDPIYLTNNSELTGASAKIELALSKTPNFRIDITGTSLDPTKVMLVRRVNGNVFGQGGGGWEIIYKGPLVLDKNNVIRITKLP